MLSCSIRNWMFTSRNLKKCALVCTTRHSTAFNIASVASQFFPVLRRHCFGQHRYTSYVYIFESALRWRENATIYKEQMQTKYSDIIKRCPVISSSEYQSPYENCSTCTFIKGPIFLFYYDEWKERLRYLLLHILFFLEAFSIHLHTKQLQNIAPQALIDGANIWTATWLYNIVLSENLVSWILDPRSLKLRLDPCISSLDPRI